ncbi:MAG TPA: hypothetical protein EYP09_04695, partial [Anaerolineae bacterium]|nr:hypothetical protein [Anaerolineae bacterium]
MIVMKFGGTSVGDGERIRQVAQIVAGVARGELGPSVQSAESVGFLQSVELHKSVVIVSAMSGVTDALIEAAKASADHDSDIVRCTAAELSRRHREAAEAVALPEERRALLKEVEALIEEFESLCQAIHVLGELTPRGLDAVAS